MKRTYHVMSHDPCGECQTQEDFNRVIQEYANKGWRYEGEVVWGRSWHHGTKCYVFVAEHLAYETALLEAARLAPGAAEASTLRAAIRRKAAEQGGEGDDSDQGS